MATTLIFLGLMTICYGQLIYPDDYVRYRTTTIPPNIFSTVRRLSVPRPPNKHIAYAYQINAQSTLSPTQAIPSVPLGASATQQTTMFPVLTDSRISETALQEWNDHVNNLIVRGIMKFALDMEREIYNTRGNSLIGQRDNIVFSPISLAVTMAIVLAGSAGRTFEEVSRVLGFEAGVDISRNSEIVHQMFGLLLSQLHNKIIDGPGPRVDFATASYVQDGYPILQQFKALSNNVYDNEVINVDFAKNGKAAQNMINDWVNRKTMGKISSILNDVPGIETTVILLSALYFNGEWNQHFLQGATKRKPFFIEPNEAIDVDLMYNGGTFPFYEDKQLGAKIVALPYKGHELSMYILLPTAKGAKALREFQKQLSVDIIENLIGNMKNETCIIGLPRMKLSSSLSLKSTLSNLGLNSLFNPSTADLSLMSQRNNGNVQAAPTMETSTTIKPDVTAVKSTVFRQPYNNNNDVLIFSRINEDNETAGPALNHVVRRNYFTYEDKVRDYTVKQWSTGFSIKKNRRIRDTSDNKDSIQKDRDSYNTDQGVTKDYDSVKVVNLEDNKYRFEKTAQKGRSKRQSRPINQDFLEFIKQRNFPSYGLDELRNTATLTNPHLYASDVLHKVEIDITERGTEAAAVTAVVLERDGNQKRLIANRPFIFFIRHNPTRLVLFWGTLNAPTPNYRVT
ncbi:Uncharacterized serpin-like protein MA_2613/MA_2612 [Anthophora quadrimaculata]